MDKTSKIYVCGHNGLVGSAILKKLQNEGYCNLLTANKRDLDLVNQKAVNEFLAEKKPEFIFLCAGKVGGIIANDFQRADFIYQNLMIQANVIHAASKIPNVKLMIFGSSCVFPRDCNQPIKEEYLLTGELEKTNEPYAISKIAALKMGQAYRSQYGSNFISVMPTNLYGSNDKYDVLNSHVIPSLIKKFHDAKKNNIPTVEVWGTGTVKREFLFVEDLADACIFLMNNYDNCDPINIGTGEDVTIYEVASLIKEVVGYDGEIVHDLKKPDGTPRKLLDVSKIQELGWKHRYTLREALQLTYEHYKKKYDASR